MITLFVTLYSLLCLHTAVKTSDIVELHVKTVKRGEDVTMECNINMALRKESVVWYRQNLGKVPQYVAKKYPGTTGYRFAEGFNNNRFSFTVNDHKFDLNIKEVREEDGGDYFCGEVDGIVLKFICGTLLQFEGEEMKHCPTPVTVNKNTDCGPVRGSNCSGVKGGDHHWIIALSTSNIISVIIIMVLVGLLFKNQTKDASSRNHQISLNQADDDVLNYAAVNFAKKPSSSTTSRDKSHQDIYAQVQIK